MIWVLMIYFFRACWGCKDMMYLFVEGPDDERFFSKVFGERWSNLTFVRYAKLPSNKINNFIKSISCTPSSDYIFIGDADGKAIEQKTQELVTKYKYLEETKVAIVQYEIESWYYAGVNELLRKKIGMKRYIFYTDQLTKEEFDSMLPKKMDRKYVLTLVLSSYDLEIAVERNHSLCIFNKNIRKELA